MKKTTMSDHIKAALSSKHGGQPDDWKRLSKSTIDGHIVREFQHRATGEVVEVKQISETRIAVRQKTPGVKPPLQCALETNPAKNAAADRVIASMLDDGEDDPDMLDGLAGRADKALANRFLFAYCALDKTMGPCWIFTPEREWTENRRVYDSYSPIESLLPKGMGEACEGAWVLMDDPLSPVDRARDLMQRGFKWDRDFQLEMDAETPFTAALEQARAAENMPKPQP